MKFKKVLKITSSIMAGISIMILIFSKTYRSSLGLVLFTLLAVMITLLGEK